MSYLFPLASMANMFAQVIAFRFASFGYVPAQSYLLLGSLLLNLLIIYLAEHLARYFKINNKLTNL